MKAPPVARLEGAPGTASSVDERACPWDPATFDAVVARHLQSMLKRATRVLGSEDMAWDAVQEALTALWEQREIPLRLAAWLDRAVVHRSMHAKRTQGRRRRHECAHARTRCHEAEDVASNRVERGELAAQVANALGHLGAEQRAVVELRDLHGLDYAAVAEQLDLPLGTVRSRLARARRQLREHLGHLVDDMGCQQHTRGTCRTRPSAVS